QSTETPREIIGYPETIVEGKLIQQPENLNDILGIVTADYQAILESEWYNSLRKNYSIVIDEKLLHEIKQGIKQ
ncbi:MAG TPA: peptidylprolyl isomerase, partial [Dysgonomonas sp.]|nr:peptidylprolyl isomerase [Dysgonomonas sp.]